MDLPGPYVMGFAAVTTLTLLVIYRLAQSIVAPDGGLAQNFTDEAPTETAAKEGEPKKTSAKSTRARRLLRVGEVLAVFGIASSVVANCLSGELGRDALVVAMYGLAGLLLLSVFGRLGVRLLFGSKLPEEIARGNVAAGVAAGGHYVAVGLLVAKAAAGQGLRDLGLALVFFVLAQLTHQVLVALFRALTTYEDSEQILGGNVAAAFSYAGASIAVAIIVGRGLQGDFEGWSASLQGFGLVVVYALLLYPVRQIVVQTLLLGGRLALRGGAIDRGIAVHRSEGTGAMEAATLVATALTIASLA